MVAGLTKTQRDLPEKDVPSSPGILKGPEFLAPLTYSGPIFCIDSPAQTYKL